MYEKVDQMKKDEEVIVSVICLTYNHQDYIRQTLDGFLAQKTTFSYEVLVHDDASTDDTAMIVKEYEKKYPETIRGIYQAENQYSKGVDVKREFIYPMAKGKYVAICEGDDYWQDPMKLQMQVQWMEDNPNCNMSVHRVREVAADGSALGATYPKFELDSCILPSRKFLELGKEYSFHTSSYMFCGQEYWKYVCDPPDFAKNCDVGDEMYMLYFGQLGDVCYIDRTMSCYRRGVVGSWTHSQRGSEVMGVVRHHELMVESLQKYDLYTDYKYHDICVSRIGRQLACAAVLNKQAGKLFQQKNREVFRTLSGKQKVFLAIAAILPHAMKKMYLLRRTMLDKKHGI